MRKPKAFRKPKVLVTREIPQAGIALLKKHCTVTVSKKKGVLTKKELLAQTKDKDGLLCLLTDNIDASFLRQNKQLQVIANYAVGYDNIDVRTAASLGIPVSNTPGVLTDAVAEHACALILALARRVAEADSFARKGKYKGWAPLLFLSTSLRGKTLGIVGSGRIGTAVAENMFRGFGMKVVYFDVQRNPFIEKQAKAKRVPLSALLGAADVVSVHVPLLPSTRHLLGSKQFRMMNKHALLVNTSRGPVIDEKALVTALKQKSIAGAALDVFENEPTIHAGLKNMPQAVLTPHIASATTEAREAMSVIAAKNILAGLAGKKLPHLIMSVSAATQNKKLAAKTSKKKGK